ncbi:DNA-processing protein DprA [Siminovitchia fortis]|uniref:DNA-protecting protein DprA n=1 Tax=Siminovitchia fortis TaxID=254758 RepID=A0A443J157_9BACI|nr:DNA-processing protein DprA [Siminovitchia fortis]RWR14194.1 DNA-protecting protein DprA [Siminovitchia fortis]
MRIFTERLLHLIHCPQVGNAAIRNLLKHDPSLLNLYSFSSSKLQQLLQLSHSSARKFFHDFQRIDINKILEKYHASGISVITFRDREYPEMLKEIYDPPLVLFFMGDNLLLKRPSIAVVGARAADAYAKKAIGLLLEPLLESGFVIVSGLAKGTDTFAHQQAIRLGGKTIAVLGGGFFHLYPPENRELAEKMKKDHLIVSEYPPIWRPQKWHFPQRNRIISGLAKGTVIVQARSRSGSLITADFALEEGREVFAVPGPIGSPLSEGANRLIQQGAKLVTSGYDILEELYIE